MLAHGNTREAGRWRRRRDGEREGWGGEGGRGGGHVHLDLLRLANSMIINMIPEGNVLWSAMCQPES